MSLVNDYIIPIAENVPKVYEAGRAKGHDEGYAEGRVEGIDIGYSDGYSAGHINGKDEGYREGSQHERSAFWNTYQDGGLRRDYEGAFAGNGWTADTLKPMWNITPSSMNQMFFANKNQLDLVSVLEAAGVVLDTSQAWNMSNVFAYSHFVRVGIIDFTSAPASAVSTFNSATKLVTIDKIILGNKAYTFTAWFNNCTSLVNLTIEGVISSSGFDVQYSSLLSKDSLISIVNALSSTTSDLWIRVSKTAVDNAFETELGLANGSSSSEWLDLKQTKANWTIYEL